MSIEQFSDSAVFSFIAAATPGPDSLPCLLSRNHLRGMEASPRQDPGRSFQDWKKTHLARGSRTACGRRLRSGVPEKATWTVP